MTSFEGVEGEGGLAIRLTVRTVLYFTCDTVYNTVLYCPILFIGLACWGSPVE